MKTLTDWFVLFVLCAAILLWVSFCSMRAQAQVNPIYNGQLQNTLDANSQFIVNLASPVNPNDAVNKSYVDTHAGGGGSGTVTSVAQSVPSWLTISGSPITTSGTLSIGAGTGAAHQYVGNNTGAPATLALVQPSFGDLTGAAATTQGGVPTGGTPQQVLAKNTATDYDTFWSTVVSSTEGIWNYKNVLTMADPATGNIRFNNAAAGSTTNLAISKTTTNGIDRTTVLSSVAANDEIEIQDQTASANWIRYRVTSSPTNNTTWFLVPVTTLEGSGTNPGNNDNLILTFRGSSGVAPVSSVFGRTGAVTAAANDYSFSLLSGNIAVGQMNSGTAATSSTFWRGDGTWATPAGGGGGTPGGSNTQLQYNNSGALGGITSLTYDGTIPETVTLAPAANTYATGHLFTDTTVATSGNQQYSPSLIFHGNGWKTTSAGSQPVDVRLTQVPVQNTVNPTSKLEIAGSVNSGSYGAIANFSRDQNGAAQLQVNGGSVALPEYAFVANNNAGMSNSSGTVSISSGGTATAAFSTSGINTQSGYRYAWTSSSDPIAGVVDTALYRNAAGVVEINNGTAGTFADLKLRNLTLNPQASAPTGPAEGMIYASSSSHHPWYYNGTTFVDMLAGGGGTPGGSNTQVQYNNAGAFGGITNATTDGTTLTIGSPKILTNIRDANTNTLLGITATTSAVNDIGIRNAATGSNPAIYAEGSDPALSIRLEPKGSSGVDLAGNSTGYVAFSILNASGGGKTWQIVNSGTTGLVGYFPPNSFVFFDNTDGKLPLELTTTQVSTNSGSYIGWWSDPSMAGQGTFDTAFYRNAAGVVEINNGTAGQYRDLRLRNLTLSAGTSSIAPLNFTSGTNLTTPTAGAIEYDGKVHYSTHAANERGVISSVQWIACSATVNLANTTSLQAMFAGVGSATNGQVTVSANTLYRFKTMFYITTLSSTSNVSSYGFGGTATISSIQYTGTAVRPNNVNVSNSAGSAVWGTQASAVAITTASANPNLYGDFEGIIRIGNTGGTLIPQFSSSVAGTTPVLQPNSFFELWPVGSDTTQVIGNWN